MAINLDDRYPGRANGKTLSYPQGSFKNRTSPTAKDGTYLEQDWANDQLAFFQSLIKDAGMTANGLVDTVEASQYFDALRDVIRRGLYNSAAAGGTANAITASFSPAITTLTNGMTLYVRAASANSTTTPTFQADSTAAKTIVKGSDEALLAGDIKGAGHWLELQYDSVLDKWVLQNPAVNIGTGLLGLNSWFEVPLVIAGISRKAIIQVGNISTSSSGAASIVFPIAFPTSVLSFIALHRGTDLAMSYEVFSSRSLSGTAIYALNLSGVPSSGWNFNWIAVGY